MADENSTNTAAPTTEVTQTEAPTDGERSYTQAEVDALVKQAADSKAAEVRRALKPKRQDDARQEKAPTPDKGVDREARREAQQDAIQDATADYGLTKEQSRKLRDRLRRDDPDDPAAWVKEEIEIFMPAKSQTATETVTAQSKETPVARQPGDSPPGVQGAPPWERPSDPFKWTEAQVQQLRAIKGTREANRIIRLKGEEYARTMRIQMTPQRR